MTIETVVQRAAGLDIAKASLVACVRVPKPDGGWQVHKRKFATMSADLAALADWLTEHKVTRVGMESTSDYWRPVYYMLEDRFECWLLNARHMRAVPGRKTDMTDAEWICDRVAHGLVRPSLVPPPPIRRLRDLTRRRTILRGDRSREKQRMEKLLDDAGIKLSVVASDIFSKSGRAMLEALIAGERDPATLAELARGRLRVKIGALTEALAGRFAEHHAFLARMILAHIDAISAMLTELGARIDEELAPYRTQVELLTSVDGVDTRTAQVIIAEIGVDMSHFPTAAHLASWAGVCPGNKQDRRQGQDRTHPPGQPLAEVRPRHRRPRRHPQEGLLPARPLRPHRTTTRRQTRAGRGRAQPAGHHLARAEHPDPLPRPRRRLLPAPGQPRTLPPTRHRPAATAGLPGHPRTGRLIPDPAPLTDFRVNSGGSPPQQRRPTGRPRSPLNKGQGASRQSCCGEV